MKPRASYLCELVTVSDAVLDPVHLNVHVDVQVFPEVSLSVFVFGKTVALDPLPLRYPRVLHGGLVHLHGVVQQVVVNDHRPHAVHLLSRILAVLLEVRKKTQHLERQERRESEQRKRRSDGRWLHRHCFTLSLPT